jgi:hypothetical protein
MSQTIDVTGLPPDAVRRLQSLVDALRKQFDPAAGAEPPATEAPPSQLPPEEWVKWFRAWAESHPKRDIEIDDSRETIYEGRGE